MAKTTTTQTRRGVKVRRLHTSWEGGCRGVIVVIASHLIITIQTMLLRSGGVLYLSWKEDFETSDQETAAVLSAFSAVSCFSVLLGGILTERLGCRFSGMLGGLLMFLGFLCGHWVTDIYQLYITISIVGLGVGFSYNSSLVVLALYFTRRYKTANAVAISGIGTGTMVGPPLFQALLENFGWRGAFLIASGIAANIVMLSALYRPTQATRKTGGNLHSEPKALGETGDTSEDQKSNENSRHSDDTLQLEPVGLPEKHGVSANNNKGYAALSLDDQNSNPMTKLLKRLAVSLGFNLLVKSYRFALLSAIQVQFNIGYMGYVLYLVPYAQSVGIAAPSAAMLLSIFGIGSLIGQLGNGVLVSWKLSAEHVTAISTATVGVSSFVLAVESYYILAIASFLLGFTSGFFFAITVVLIRQYVGVRKLAIGCGLSNFFLGIGAVTGPLFAGWILDLTTDSYRTVFFILGGVNFFCAAQLLVLPLLRRIEPGMDLDPTDV